MCDISEFDDRVDSVGDVARRRHHGLSGRDCILPFLDARELAEGGEAAWNEDVERVDIRRVRGGLVGRGQRLGFSDLRLELRGLGGQVGACGNGGYDCRFGRVGCTGGGVGEVRVLRDGLCGFARLFRAECVG